MTRCPVAIGEVIADKYRVERILGEGGMGVVVAATHVLLGQPVALKFLIGPARESPEARARFLREARAAVRIQSEHVARILDVGSLPDGSPYIVMEYLEGADLASVLERSGPPPVEQAVPRPPAGRRVAALLLATSICVSLVAGGRNDALAQDRPRSGTATRDEWAPSYAQAPSGDIDRRDPRPPGPGTRNGTPLAAARAGYYWLGGAIAGSRASDVFGPAYGVEIDLHLASSFYAGAERVAWAVGPRSPYKGYHARAWGDSLVVGYRSVFSSDWSGAALDIGMVATWLRQRATDDAGGSASVDLQSVGFRAGLGYGISIHPLVSLNLLGQASWLPMLRSATSSTTVAGQRAEASEKVSPRESLYTLSIVLGATFHYTLAG